MNNVLLSPLKYNILLNPFYEDPSHDLVSAPMFIAIDTKQKLYEYRNNLYSICFIPLSPEFTRVFNLAFISKYGIDMSLNAPV